MVVVLLCAGLASSAAATDLDRSFSGGFVETRLPARIAEIPGAPNIWDMAPDRSGGFVAALADLTTERNVFGVARYRRNGRLDRRFGMGGFTRPIPLSGGPAQAQAIAVQPDGRIVLAGFWRGPSGYRMLVARFHPRGSLDHSFGRDGIVLQRRTRRGLRGEALHDVAVLPGGRIVAVGATGEHGIGESSRRPAALVIAFRRNGDVDRSFGKNGRITFPARGGGEYTGLKTVRPLPGGRLLVVGFHHGSLFAARLLPNGRLDSRFGNGDGKLKMSVNDEQLNCSGTCFSETSVAVRSDGRILLLSSPAIEVPALIRLFPNGRLDRAFGKRGIVKVHLKRHRFLLFDMALQQGRILLVGWDEATRKNPRLRFSVLRYGGNGRLDRSFGRKGLWIRGGAPFSGAFATLRQQRGRVVVAGGSERKPDRSSAYESSLWLARLLPR